MGWREYETEIFDRLRRQFPDTELVCDSRLDGRISGIQRQIDILACGKLMDARPFAVIDCKYFAQRVNIAVVESFLGLLADVRAHVGVLVTNVGYSDAAGRRATNDPTREVRLHVVELSELRALPVYRLIYFGSLGVRLAIPPMWTMTSGKERVPGVASWDLLPNYLSREAAYRLPRWGCVSLMPLSQEHFLIEARRLLRRQHILAQQRGHVQYRSENWHTGDITYRRTRLSDREVEYSATCVAQGLLVAVELQTTPEHESEDEEFVTQVARSMIAIAASEPQNGSCHAEVWAEASPQLFGIDTKQQVP